MRFLVQAAGGYGLTPLRAHSDISVSILPGGSHFKLSDLHGQPLSFNPSATLRPDPAHLAWHRREVFGS